MIWRGRRMMIGLKNPILMMSRLCDLEIIEICNDLLLVHSTLGRHGIKLEVTRKNFPAKMWL